MDSPSYMNQDMVVRDLDGGSALRGAVTGELFAYWQAKRGDRLRPDWPDIVLMDLWRIAACVVVKDVLADGDDFRNRFWGTRLTEAVGIEGTGKTLREMYGPASETNMVNYRSVVENGTPLVTYRRLTFIGEREHIVREAVHLPLGPDGGPITHLISSFDYDCDVADLLGD